MGVFVSRDFRVWGKRVSAAHGSRWTSVAAIAARVAPQVFKLRANSCCPRKRLGQLAHEAEARAEIVSSPYGVTQA